MLFASPAANFANDVRQQALQWLRGGESDLRPLEGHARDHSDFAPFFINPLAEVSLAHVGQGGQPFGAVDLVRAGVRVAREAPGVDSRGIVTAGLAVVASLEANHLAHAIQLAGEIAPLAPDAVPSGLTVRLFRSALRQGDPAFIPFMQDALATLKNKPQRQARLARLASRALPPHLAVKHPAQVPVLLELVAPVLRGSPKSQDLAILSKSLHIGLAVAGRVAEQDSKAASNLVKLAANSLPADEELQRVAMQTGVRLAPVLSAQNASEATTLLDTLLDKSSPSPEMIAVLVKTKMSLLPTIQQRNGVVAASSALANTAKHLRQSPQAAVAFVVGGFGAFPFVKSLTDDGARGFLRELVRGAETHEVARVTFVQQGFAHLSRGGASLFEAILSLGERTPDFDALLVQGCAAALPSLKGTRDGVPAKMLDAVTSRLQDGDTILRGQCLVSLFDALPGTTKETAAPVTELLSTLVGYAEADPALAHPFLSGGVALVPEITHQPVVERLVRHLETVWKQHPALVPQIIPAALESMDRIAAVKANVFALPVLCAALGRIPGLTPQDKRALHTQGLAAVDELRRQQPMMGTVRPALETLDALVPTVPDIIARDRMVDTALSLAQGAGAGNACVVSRLFSRLVPMLPREGVRAAKVVEIGRQAMLQAAQWDMSAAQSFATACCRSMSPQSSVAALNAGPVDVMTLKVPPVVVAQAVPPSRAREIAPRRSGPPPQRLFR